ncbi:MAG: glycosyltransferase family 2 protein, partial [Gammaproteobacteria bacterium]|nr:glycosyltransferase family 2 protein [Gammaproteobacteria bacterium]
LFFPCHNEAENLEALVADALTALPALAATYEVILVDDGSRDDTAGVAERLAHQHSGIVRVVRHDVNRGYGGALRSGFAAARYNYLAYTDGDRQFRVADLARLVERAEATQSPVVIGYRLQRADPPLRLVYASIYRVANRVWFGLNVRDVDCAAKLFRRDALKRINVHSDGAFFSAELLIRLRLAGVSIAEVGVPHYPRTAGSPTGARLSVITRAVLDFWSLRIGLWLNRARALARGRALLND